MPLRQPPAEQPFSAYPQTANPVRNDWVLLLFGIDIFCDLAAAAFPFTLQPDRAEPFTSHRSVSEITPLLAGRRRREVMFHSLGLGR